MKTKIEKNWLLKREEELWGKNSEQYKMVKEALHERANLLAIAPHLSFPLPIMLPVYT